MSDSENSSNDEFFDSSSSSSSSSSGSDEEMINLLAGAAHDRIELANREKIPCRTSALRGHMYAQEVLDGSPVRFREVCRMDKVSFQRLMNHLEGFLEDTIHVSAIEQVMIFLFVVGHSGSNCLAGERFQHSGETISRYYNLVLDSLVELQDRIIVQPEPGSQVPEKIRETAIFNPFQGCVGAIDGTHVQAVIPEAEQAGYRDHHGNHTQNVLAGCDFDGNFTFVMAGFEGRAHDSHVLEVARRDGRFMIPPGQYYLADAGYSNQEGFLAPYRGTRYHLKQWGVGAARPRDYKEIFNCRHSSLRNIVERLFGVWKVRFPVLQFMRRFPFKQQAKLVVALAVLHNIIRQCGEDVFFNEYDERERVRDLTWEEAQIPPYHAPTAKERALATTDRDILAFELWNDYLLHPHRG